INILIQESGKPDIVKIRFPPLKHPSPRVIGKKYSIRFNIDNIDYDRRLVKNISKTLSFRSYSEQFLLIFSTKLILNRRFPSHQQHRNHKGTGREQGRTIFSLKKSAFCP